MRVLWKANGNYNADAAEKEHLEAIAKWKTWLTEKIDDGEVLYNHFADKSSKKNGNIIISLK